jgi:hypothetical protein
MQCVIDLLDQQRADRFAPFGAEPIFLELLGQSSSPYAGLRHQPDAIAGPAHGLPSRSIFERRC